MRTVLTCHEVHIFSPQKKDSTEALFYQEDAAEKRQLFCFVLYNQLLKKHYNTIVRNTSSLKFNKVISYLKEEDLEKVFGS